MEFIVKRLKTIIAGSRTFTDYNLLSNYLDLLDIDISEVVSGAALGADTMGEQWATAHNIPIKRFPADWDQYGRSAGYRRNVEMGDYADACILFWDLESKGTKHMLDIAKRKELKLFVFVI